MRSPSPMRRTTRSITAGRPAIQRRPGLRHRVSSPKSTVGESTTSSSSSVTSRRNNGHGKSIIYQKHGSNNKRGLSQEPLRKGSKPTIREKQSIIQKGIKRKAPITAATAAVPTVKDPATNIKVIVLGAGIAGLACAKELIKRGYSVIILEGRTRPGGRLKSVPLRLDSGSKQQTKQQKSSKGKYSHPLSQRYDLSSANQSQDESIKDKAWVDVGGAFIHGIQGNPLYTVAKKMGISTSGRMKDCHLLEYNNTGWPVSAEIDLKVQKRFNYVLEKSFEMSKNIMDLEEGAPSGGSVTNDGDDTKEEAVHDMNPIKLEDSIPLVGIPEDANASTSFGSIFYYIAFDGQVPLSQSAGKANDHSNDILSGGYPLHSIEGSLFQWHVLNLEMSCGTDLYNLGLTWNEDEQYGFDGAHVLLREGFSCLVEGLAEGINIKYGMEVTGIRIVDNREASNELSAKYESGKENWSSDEDDGPAQVRRSARKTRVRKMMNIGVLNEDQKELGTYDVSDELMNAYTRNKKTFDRRSQVQVRMKSGLTLEANAVVCTFPLGVLKEENILFSPPLPQRKQDAIARIGFGRYNKCALSFSHVFWNSADDFIGVIGSPVAGTSILCCNLSIVNNLPCIVIIYGGSYAEEVEDLTDKIVVEEFMNVLRRVYGNNIPVPIDYSVSRWGKDRYARGSFSYIPPGVDGFQELQTMSEPIYAYDRGNSDRGKSKLPCLLFAGEATSAFHPSTIHGAFCSGIREAYRLDLAFSPEMNNNLVFEDGVLYRGTFGVPRRVVGLPHSSTSSVAETNESSLQQTSNSHRIGSRKSIRKQMKTDKDEENKETVMIRKSKRIKNVEVKSVENQVQREVQQTQFGELSIVEDTAILRGVDVHGRDREGIKKINVHMFPVPPMRDNSGLSKVRSDETIFRRYKELVSGGADVEPICDDKTENEWLASPESKEWWENIAVKTKNTSKRIKKMQSLTPSRKSRRKISKRDLMNL